MKLTFVRILLFICATTLTLSAYAQNRASFTHSRSSVASPYAAHGSVISEERPSGSPATAGNIFVPLPPAVAVPGTTYIGIATKYHLQSNHGGLHNVQVDPSNSQNIHACVMSVPNVTESD